MNRLKTKRNIFLYLCLLITFNAVSQSSTFEFVENKGQWDSKIKYTGTIGAGAFFLQQQGFTVVLQNPKDIDNIIHRTHPLPEADASASRTRANRLLPPQDGIGGGGPDGISTPRDSFIIRAHAYRVDFEGSNATAAITPEKEEEYYNNYFLGDDPSKWRSNARVFRTVNYKSLYPGIDLRYYAENGTLKYDFIVQPGADPGIIAMKYTGADKLSIKNNQLVIQTSVGNVVELAPYSYQYLNGKSGRTQVNCKFEIENGNVVRFKVKNYSSTVPLIIDPTLIFSSFTGGTNNYGFTATPGPDGSLFSGSASFAPGFPITTGAYQTTFGGGDNPASDMGIMKFSPTGTQRRYSTYIGGNKNDYPHSLICDPQGNLIIMGRSYSTNFPGTKVGPNGECDLVVIKLNSTGSAIIGALKIGGTADDAVNIKDQLKGVGKSSTIRFYGDDARGEVNLDGQGNIYVTSQTKSTNFPVTNPFQGANGGGQDGVVLKITPNCSGVTWSSYLGGSGNDASFVLDLNPLTGDVYVAGTTESKNFPGTAPGVVQPAFTGGLTDAFISVINSGSGALIRSTYMGTNAYDAIYGLKFDKFGFPYVMGISEGAWWVENAAYSNANSKQFVTKLQPDLSARVYSTVYGSGSALPNISPIAFLVDRCENVYISGWGGWIGGASSEDPFGMAGVNGMPITPDAIKRTTDNRDFYFIVLKKNAGSLLYGSYFGQGGGLGEHVDGGTSRFDQQGVIYQALCANCFNDQSGALNPPYLTTPGAVARVNGAGRGGCNLGALKISFNFAGVDAGVRAFVNAVFDTSGCVPLRVTFRDTVRIAKSYEWSFGDGSPDTTTTGFEVSHVYNNVGTYRLRLIAVDSQTCNIRDTAFISIIVRNDQAFLGFTATKLPPCQSLAYRFDNLSTAPPTKPFGPNAFIWDFGDGIRVQAGPGSITHSYAAPGTYIVKLILPDTNYCNSPDSVVQQLRISPLVDALFETPPTGCSPYLAQFNNTSLAGQQFFWDFGDGSTSTDINPTHLYANPGTYTIRMIAIDSSTCNIIDSTSQTISVSLKPTAAYTYSPQLAVENTPYVFTNGSSPDAVRFKWDFGDGDTLLTRSRADIEHLYNTAGVFNACLMAFNDVGCVDTVCNELQAIVVPKLDLPNAFTPLGNANNNTISVRGFGIGRIQWRIYNRFGNLVFETNDRNKGWDGKYKGVVQPMDVYAYTLEVEFTDGTRATKKGDITLIR